MNTSTRCHPLFELSTRTAASGGAVGPAVPKTDALGFTGGKSPGEHDDHLVFLVHGYNNSFGKADHKWWDKTLGRLAAFLNDPQSRADHQIWQEPATVLFYWPGEVKLFPVFSAATFPLAIPKALASAEELARYIHHHAQHVRGRNLRVSFIGHSLGCRLVLETLRLLDGDASVTVESVLLMAAAVPWGMCDPYEGLYRKKVAEHEDIAYSPVDAILGLFFVPGEAFESRLAPSGLTAVGLRGLPPNRWTSSKRLFLNHGRYWTSKKSFELMKPVYGTRSAPIPSPEIVPPEVHPPEVGSSIGETPEIDEVFV